MNLKKLLSGTLAATLAAGGIAWAATQTLTLGASTGPGGILTMFGSTSGSLTMQPPAVAGTGSTITFPSGTTDFSGTIGVLQQATTGAAITVGPSPAALLATGTSVSLTAPRQYYECTGACSVTPPVPVAGYEFCVRNANNTTGAIALQALGSSARYEVQAKTSYGSAGTGTLTSGGAVTDEICIVGKDSTHYDIWSITGTWTAT